MGTITKASYERLAAECAEWHKRAVAAESAVERTEAALDWAMTCSRDSDTWEESIAAAPQHAAALRASRERVSVSLHWIERLRR